jgi:putative oxidoreductase
MSVGGAILTTNPLNRDLGLLVVRVGVGLSMAIFHGWGKISGGTPMWERVGGSMAHLGIDFLPVMWGFLAAFSEFGCSILLVLGFLFRPAAAMLAFTMLVAVITHLNMPPDSPSAGWNGASHALELGSVYLMLLLAGPGKLALSYRE